MGKIIYKLFFEFFGCVMLGCFLNYSRMDSKNSGINVFHLPLLCWLPYAFAWKVSGGHLNPAVTLANMLRMDGEFKVIEGLLYMPVQFLGMWGGIMFAWWQNRDAGRLVIFDYQASNPWYEEAMAMELVCSFVFVLVHLLQQRESTAMSENAAFQTLTVGSFYGAIVYISAYRTGGSLNPAYGLAQTLADLADDGHDFAMEYTYIYVLFPLIGAIIAWALYQFIYVKAFEEPIDKDEIENKM